MIRRTLSSTQAATFSILLPDSSRQGLPTPAGTGFFVSGDGLFVTARHVVVDRDNGEPRSDIDAAWLQKERRSFDGGAMCQWPELVWEDKETDVALLKVDFRRNAPKDWLKDQQSFPYLRVSTRE